MMHSNRIWCVTEVESAEELALKLTTGTWCCCQAFRIKGHSHYVWLNDSTSEDGAQEYAVCRQDLATGDLRQLESISFSWCDRDRALQFIFATLSGDDDHNEWARPVTANLQSPEEHHHCQHCA